MKKQIIAGGFILASLGSACAQGLYDISPNYDAKESLPITWTAGVSVGYDDNVSPTVVKNPALGSSTPGYEEDSASISAYVGASWVSVTPQTTWDVYGRIGGTYYFDAPSTLSNDGYGEARLGLNWTHRVSERLRFTSRNYLAYEMEPDYNYGIALDRQLDPYFFYRTYNAVGYRWSERFATYTGFSYTGVDYGSDASANDRDTLGFFNQFRYRSSEQTVWTLDYRYSMTTASGSAQDSDSHYILAGVEHRFSPNTVGLMKVGAQMRDSDGGSSDTSPFFEGTLRSQVNDQFSVRAFARYSMEDYGTSFGSYYYDLNNVFRLGASASYAVSPQLTLNAGVNFITTDFQEASNGVDDLDQDLWNASVGFSYEINEAFYIVGSYNYTDSSSSGGTATSSDSREYARNTASLGVRMEF